MVASPDEIARIEHELAILRDRYASFGFWSKWYCIAAAAMVLVTIVSYGFIGDPVIAGFVILIIAVCGALVYLSGLHREARWIDAASPPPVWPWGRIFNIGPKSEAAAIEAMIAEREARLAELEGSRR